MLKASFRNFSFISMLLATVSFWRLRIQHGETCAFQCNHKNSFKYYAILNVYLVSFWHFCQSLQIFAVCSFRIELSGISRQSNDLYVACNRSYLLHLLQFSFFHFKFICKRPTNFCAKALLRLQRLTGSST